MDLESLLIVGSAVKRLKMFPCFDVANYILMCLTVRDDYHPQTKSGGSFSRLHPLSSWVGSMMMCFAGGILGNFLLGDPLIAPFKSGRDVLLATAVWYFINYSPFDFIHNLCVFTPIKAIICTLKEVHRANKVHHAVLSALKSFPDAYILVAIYGVLKGSAATHMRLFQRLVCGVWQPGSIEILKPCVMTKASTVAVILFLLDFTGYVDIDETLLYLSVVVFFLVVHFLTYFGVDPFIAFENLFCSVFMGGMMDALNRARKQQPEPPVNPSSKTRTTTNGRKAKEE